MNKLQYRTEGRYYLGESTISAQYVFQFREDAPKDLNRSFLIDIDEDGKFSGSALDVAYELQNIIDGYLFSSYQPRIKAVVEYLEKWEEKDIYDGLKEERERLTKRLEEVENKLKAYDPEEWDDWQPENTESTEQTQAE